jgi:hypothetical protein
MALEVSYWCFMFVWELPLAFSPTDATAPSAPQAKDVVSMLVSSFYLEIRIWEFSIYIVDPITWLSWGFIAFLAFLKQYQQAAWKLRRLHFVWITIKYPCDGGNSSAMIYYNVYIALGYHLVRAALQFGRHLIGEVGIRRINKTIWIWPLFPCSTYFTLRGSLEDKLTQI